MRYPVMSGEECFHSENRELPVTVKNFWAWSMSRLLADGPRADLAEFIVNTALGLDITNAKRGWGECDILYEDIRIEIKCSSLLQAWERKSPSNPVFSIAKTLNCDVKETETGYVYVGRDSSEPQRRSDIYVFCLFANSDRASADPLDMDQWRFFVVPTHVINEKCGNKKSLTLNGIQRLGDYEVKYGQIKSAVDSVINSCIYGPYDTVEELMKALNSD